MAEVQSEEEYRVDDLNSKKMEEVTKLLLAVTKTKLKGDETAEELSKRVVRKAHGLSNADWEKLSEPAQRYVNHAMLRFEDEKEPDKLLTLDEPSGEAGQQRKETKVATADKKTGAKKGAEKAAKGKPAAVKETKPAKAKETKAAAGKANGRATQRGKFPLEAKIKVLVKENPKREGSKGHGIFALYKDGMTVEKALAVGIPWRDMSWDTEHEFIAIK